MKISKFSNEELSQIRILWSVDCPEIADIPTNSTCKTHNIKHDRLPDLKTWKKLKELYPFGTLQAWAEAFYVSRESIRQLNLLETSKNIVGEIKTSNFKPEQDKLISYFGANPVYELFDKFFDLYFNFPNKGLDNILNFIGMDKTYFQYWIDNDESLYIEYKNAKEKRVKKKQNPSYLKCYKCKKVKLPDEFGTNNSTKSRISNVCRTCNNNSEAIRKAIQDKVYDAKETSSKNCLMCGKTKNLRSFKSGPTGKSGFSYCSSCRAKRRDSKMREKILLLGVEDHDRICISCNKLCGIEDFYLIRGFQIRNNPVPKTFLTQECRRCVHNVIKDFPSLRELILSRWRNELRKVGSENYIKFNQFLDTYLKTIRKDLNVNK